MSKPRIASKQGKGEGEDSVMSLPLLCKSGLFAAWGRPRMAPAVADGYGSFSKPCVFPDAKERGSPQAILCTWSGITRWLETESRGETDLLIRKRHRGIQWPLSRSDNVSQTAGGPLLDSGQIQKCSSVYTSQWVIYCFAHYNIQPDIMSSWPCVTSVRNHGIHI